MNNLVVIQNNQVVVSSKAIAEHFGKEHKNVLQNIRDILVAENSATKFFQQSSTVYRGQEFPMYLMNRDGFSLLAMGFTGKKALQWKLKYIEAFNEMEKSIQQGYIEAPDLGCKTYKGQPVMTINDFAALANRNRSTILWHIMHKGLSHIKLTREDIDVYKRENNIPCKQAISAIVVFTEDTAYKLASILFNRTDEINVAIANYFGKQPVAVKKEKPKLLPLSEYSDIKAQAEVINERIITIKHLLDRAFTRKNTPNTLYAYNSILLDLGVNIGNDMVGLSEHIDDVLNAFIDE